jgi:hypothetical protein
MTLDFIITFLCTVVLLVGYAIGRVDAIHKLLSKPRVVRKS